MFYISRKKDVSRLNVSKYWFVDVDGKYSFSTTYVRAVVEPHEVEAHLILWSVCGRLRPQTAGGASEAARRGGRLARGLHGQRRHQHRAALRAAAAAARAHLLHTHTRAR